jgi:DNA mismatch repair protein PMS2
MARKHATSKIRCFQDIYSNHTATLGFRGEALFCLANISENLTVITRSAGDELGQKMDYQRDGEVKQDSVAMVPRTIGTTVTVSKLFHALPVRRSDMIKRIKAQRAKVISIIQGCTYHHPRN